MIAQADVLAVMDAAAEWRGDFMGDFTSAAELKAASAAVADLIAERDALREALVNLIVADQAYDAARKGWDQAISSHPKTWRSLLDSLAAAVITRTHALNSAIASTTGESA